MKETIPHDHESDHEINFLRLTSLIPINQFNLANIYLSRAPYSSNLIVNLIGESADLASEQSYKLGDP